VLAAWGNGILSPGHAPFIPNNINPNFYTVSIEHVKAHDDNSDQLTPIQTQKSFELIKCLCDTYGIPKRAGDANGGILAHNQITQTACPGPYPWDALYNYLKGGNKPMPPQPPTANQIKAANNRWNSVLKNTVAGPAPTGSGIYNAWLADYTQSKFHGPPLTHEYDSVDWNGKPIIIQEFSYGWAEWTGKVTWYDAEGAMG
jgi:hypothetical protein